MAKKLNRTISKSMIIDLPFGFFIYLPLFFGDFSIKLTNTPDGAVKLEIEHALPADCGAYKLVISNPNGENVALCAVAVRREFERKFDI